MGAAVEQYLRSRQANGEVVTGTSLSWTNPYRIFTRCTGRPTHRWLILPLREVYAPERQRWTELQEEYR